MSFKFKSFGKARRRKGDSRMNSLEREYADYLNALLMAGEIHAWWFEPKAWSLGPNTSYKPDFMVQMPDGTIEMHETKGRWTPQARIKIKLAANMYPFIFRAVTKATKKEGGGWKYEVFHSDQLTIEEGACKVA